MSLENISLGEFIKNSDWWEVGEHVIRFPMSEDSIKMLKTEFEYELHRKPMHKGFKQNYFVNYGDTFNLSAYFKYHLFGELNPKEYKACIMDTPRHHNLAIISSKKLK